MLGRARALHPDARRALLIEWGAWADRSIAARDPAVDGGRRTSATTCSSRGSARRVVPPGHRRVRAGVVAQRGLEPTARSSWSPTAVGARAREIASLLTRNGIPQRVQRAWFRLANMVTNAIEASIGADGSDIANAEVLVWMPAIGGTVLHGPDRRRGRRGVGASGRR